MAHSPKTGLPRESEAATHDPVGRWKWRASRARTGRVPLGVFAIAWHCAELVFPRVRSEPDDPIDLLSRSMWKLTGTLACARDRAQRFDRALRDRGWQMEGSRTDCPGRHALWVRGRESMLTAATRRTIRQGGAVAISRVSQDHFPAFLEYRPRGLVLGSDLVSWAGPAATSRLRSKWSSGGRGTSTKRACRRDRWCRRGLAAPSST